MSGRRTATAVVFLTAFFTGMRLAHLIAWPWWLVLCPLWACGGVLLGVLFVLCVAWLVRQ
jgi:fatty acid desaturase